MTTLAELVERIKELYPGELSDEMFDTSAVELEESYFKYTNIKGTMTIPTKPGYEHDQLVSILVDLNNTPVKNSNTYDFVNKIVDIVYKYTTEDMFMTTIVDGTINFIHSNGIAIFTRHTEDMNYIQSVYVGGEKVISGTNSLEVLNATLAELLPAVDRPKAFKYDWADFAVDDDEDEEVNQRSPYQYNQRRQTLLPHETNQREQILDNLYYADEIIDSDSEQE